jgi:LPS export ABC transporter protein LptC
MQKTATGILLGVVLFVTIVVGVLIVKGHRGAAPPDIVPAQSDQQIKEIHLQEDGKTGYRWSLDAEQADSYNSTGKTLLRKVVLAIEEPTRKWTITGDEGDLVQQTRDVEMRGNIVLTSSDGLRLETSRLLWSNSESRAWTEAPVTIYRSGVVVTGSGLDTRPAEEFTVVRGPVQATFVGSKGGARQAAAAPPPARRARP